MPKYWGKQMFCFWSFPEVGQKQKTEEREKREKKERLNDDNNNGQATHGARKHAWRTQAVWANLCPLQLNTWNGFQRQVLNISCSFKVG